MSVSEKIKTKFEKLLGEAEKILIDCGWNGRELYRHPNDISYLNFRTEALNLICRACGENSEHYQELRRIAEHKDSEHNSYYFTHCLGVLKAAKKDFEEGMLIDLKQLVSAEVLADFLEQAEHLLKNGYHIPAASLAGAVLEDRLRKLCEKKGIPVPEKTTIDRLNAELAKADVYDKLIQKRIIALADLRNNADHGHFTKVKSDDVSDMIKSIQKLLTDELILKG